MVVANPKPPSPLVANGCKSKNPLPPPCNDLCTQSLSKLSFSDPFFIPTTIYCVIFESSCIGNEWDLTEQINTEGRTFSPLKSCQKSTTERQTVNRFLRVVNTAAHQTRFIPERHKIMEQEMTIISKSEYYLLILLVVAESAQNALSAGPPR